MRRIYEPLILEHFQHVKQMLFLVGPRQAGKTTAAKQIAKQFAESVYLNWDVIADRQHILSGQHFIESIFPTQQLREQKPLIIFDEIHKFKNWKNYLKGFFDRYSDDYHILVTGSARLDVFQSGGDSLMGRYFHLRLHPLSLRECILSSVEGSAWHNTIESPIAPPAGLYEQLYQFGGFPAVFLDASPSFFNRWQSLRQKQLFYEDIQNLTHIHEIGQLEILAELLKLQTGQLLNRSNLASKVQVTNQTIARWIEALERFYYCFTVPPWSHNLSRSIVKEPKIFLWDWSLVEDPGARFENFIASHLLKAVHLWNDRGLGHYGLYYLRNKDQREVDFLITHNQKPWFLIEAKSSSNQPISSSLYLFQEQLQAKHALQVVHDLPYVDRSCFESNKPLIVPARTLLSQLV